MPSAPVAFSNRRIVTVDGPPGAGKTTAVTLLARAMPPAHIVRLEPRSTDKHVIETLHTAVIGAPAGRTRRADLLAHLRTRLAHTRLLIVVDEAQNAGVAALDMLRHLFEDPSAQWAMPLAGANLTDKLNTDATLSSRVGLRVQFPPIALPDLADTLRDLHPVFEQVPHQWLVELDQQACRGNLREWVKTAEWLTRLHPGTGPVPANVVRQAAVMINGRVSMDLS